jgi:hypothetical protein
MVNVSSEQSRGTIVKRKLIATLLLMMAPGIANAEGKGEKKDFDLVSVCKTDCPKAKDNEDAHACAEKLGRLNKEFRKSKCWDENEKYEAQREEKHED